MCFFSSHFTFSVFVLCAFGERIIQFAKSLLDTFASHLSHVYGAIPTVRLKICSTSMGGFQDFVVVRLPCFRSEALLLAGLGNGRISLVNGHTWHTCKRSQQALKLPQNYSELRPKVFL